jgi:single-strand DNA-binding protein
MRPGIQERNTNLKKKKDMECLNKVQLRGYVGNVSKTAVGDTQCVRFSVATNYAYKGKGGEPVVETTWHSCVAWANNENVDVAAIAKGAKVELSGRLRQQRYVDANGNDRSFVDIYVGKLTAIEE